MTINVGLVGNPNCGKTTLFNKLTGSSQRVGNWPGVTVEKVEGTSKHNSDVNIIDLPGIYSARPYTPEENVTLNYLLNGHPDVVINVVDATNLERNLYLTAQLLDMGLPVVVALNMIDAAEDKGIEIDPKKLSESLGCCVVRTSAVKNIGLNDLIDKTVLNKDKIVPPVMMSDDIEDILAQISSKMGVDTDAHVKRWYSVKIIEKDEEYISEHPAVWQQTKDIVESFEKRYDDRSDSILAGKRYDAIDRIVKKAVTRKNGSRKTMTEKIDLIVTNRWLGLPIFIGILFAVYYIAMSSVGQYATDWVNDTFFGEWIIPGTRDTLTGMSVDPVVIGLIVDGLISGVGAVLGFLPQILILFVLLVLLEDCGYMARICFVLDRIFRKFNLSGKSVIPLMVGTGCGVPGIMSSRGIKDDSERRLTVITTTFIPCSAKLPIIALIAGALFGGSALVAVFAYILGIVCVLISGVILKKTKYFAGAASTFIMELPQYHLPSSLTVLSTTLERGWQFVKKAGTFILLASGLIWFLSSFGWNMSLVDDVGNSILASIGNSICWIFSPLGWGDDWQFSVATITGLLAKENVVGTFGVLFSYGEVSESGMEIWNILSTMLTSSAALSFLAFNLICAPCFAAIGAMKRELGTWRRTLAAAAYQCTLAYLVAMMIYQFGTFIEYRTIGIGLIVAVVVLIMMVAMMVSKDPFRSSDRCGEADAQ